MFAIRRLLSTSILLCLVMSFAARGNDRVVSLSALDCKMLHQSSVITDQNPIPCHRLSRVTFDYHDEQGRVKRHGQLIVLDVIAPQVAKLTKALFKSQFMIAKARTMAPYLGDDKTSMIDNNTSAFNGRAITNGKSWSLHAYGVAIDINPVQNPFIDIAKDGSAMVSPAQSARHAVNRLNARVGKVPRLGLAEEVVDLFAQHGFFIWGGDWNYPIDYQHFQIGSRSFITRLVAMPLPQAKLLLKKQITRYMLCQKTHATLSPLKRRAYCAERVLNNMKG